MLDNIAAALVVSALGLIVVAFSMARHPRRRM
jgi:hypothetical protein